MPPPASQPQRVILIDEEWASTLVGLPMKVPNSWWKGYKKDDATMNAGTIVGVDFDAPRSNYFQLKCVDEIYAMRYDAVYLYADVNHVDYDKFTLPPDALANPASEDDVIAPVQKKKNNISMWRLDDNDDSDDDNNEDDDYFATPKKRNNNAGKRTHKKRKTTINPDLVLGAEFENEGTADMGDEEEGDSGMDDDDGSMVEPKKYGLTTSKDWTMHVTGGGRPIEPVPYIGEAELFGVKLAEGDLEKLRDTHGVIRFHLVFEWLLPTVGDEEGFYEFIAGRMRNYMIHIMKDMAFKPSHFDPYDEKHIKADHVTRFFGCQLVRAIKGLPSVKDCWSTRESLDAVGTAKESLPRGAFTDMQRCMHFADDWEEEEEAWNDYFTDVKVESPLDVAHHRRKFAIVEDAFNARWKEAVIFGRRLTMDESRTPGWYHGPTTQGPEPKPVRTGATMHTVCVTDGPLATYKLHARTFGGKSDEDLQSRHVNVATTQKWVNLQSILLDAFKGKGHCVTMDSAYMGDIMAQIGRDEWKMNMVGTAQSNRTGANVKDIINKMKVGTYESCFWQHNNKNLVYAAWSDNAIVKTLSNFHRALSLDAINGVMRRGKDENGSREMKQKALPCPTQTKEYCETFHLIDKGNGREAKYDMAGATRSHNWAPKLVFRMFNMAMNNAYVVFRELVSRQGDGSKPLLMGKAVRELAHSLCQRGEPIRNRATTHPSNLRDMDRVDGHLTGRKIWSDRKSGVKMSPPKSTTVIRRMGELTRQKKKQPWRYHQSLSATTRGRCSWAKCPGIEKK